MSEDMEDCIARHLRRLSAHESFLAESEHSPTGLRSAPPLHSAIHQRQLNDGVAPDDITSSFGGHQTSSDRLNAAPSPKSVALRRPAPAPTAAAVSSASSSSGNSIDSGDLETLDMPSTATTTATTAATTASKHEGSAKPLPSGSAATVELEASCSRPHPGGLPGASSSTRLPGGASLGQRYSHLDLERVDRIIQARLKAAGQYYTKNAPDAAYIKSQAWSQRRQRQNEALRLEQEAAELEDCTFHPDIRSESVGSGSSRAAVLHDPAVVQHVARLEVARQQRRDFEEKIRGPPLATLSPTKTIPQPFHLGERVAEPIKSLRQPCPLKPQRLDESVWRAATDAGLPTAAVQKEAEAEEEEAEVLRMMEAYHSGDGADSDVDRLFQRYSEQLAEKDALIKAQQEDIELLQNELRAVRDMLRQVVQQRTATTMRL